MGVLGLGRGEGHWRNDQGPKEAEPTACRVLRAGYANKVLDPADDVA